MGNNYDMGNNYENEQFSAGVYEFDNNLNPEQQKEALKLFLKKFYKKADDFERIYKHLEGRSSGIIVESTQYDFRISTRRKNSYYQSILLDICNEVMNKNN